MSELDTTCLLSALNPPNVEGASYPVNATDASTATSAELEGEESDLSRDADALRRIEELEDVTISCVLQSNSFVI